MTDLTEIFGPVIHSYSRAQAIADGVLIDVSATAREAGFTVPVALTSAAHNKCVRVPDGVIGQDEAGRLWDVLFMLRVAIKRSAGATDRVDYKLTVRNHNRERLTVNDEVMLKSLCGPGDDAEPVITIMLPDED